MKDKKKWVIGILCTLVCIMAVGYAVLAQQLNITGTTSIDSTWKVEITNIQEKEVVGKAVSKVTPSYTSTTANFSVGLIQPGDSITYDIEVTNSGTLDAVLESINVTTDETEAINYTTSGMKKGDKLTKNGGKNTLTIKVEYDSSITSQPSVTVSDIAVTLNYQQDLGQVVVYDEYAIGDTVTFAGSNWYVIKNSTSDEDYVTLMKEKGLTHAELGEYASNASYTCDEGPGGLSPEGCTTVGEIVVLPINGMPYYYSDICHHNGHYGYTDEDTSGCEGHNDYEGSKVKEMLEGTYINTLGSDNLKEVDGYKIRLITIEEISTNLGWTDLKGDPKDEFNMPAWFSSGGRYWTMSSYSENSSKVWYVDGRGSVYWFSVDEFMAVRPVINLLKSSI